MQLHPAKRKAIETVAKQTPSENYLGDCIDRALIIAYKESTQQLEFALSREGFRCEVQRQETKPEFQNFSQSYLCLMNHLRAWEIAILEAKPTLIVEADFVPVIGFGKLPLPYKSAQFCSSQTVVVTKIQNWLIVCAKVGIDTQFVIKRAAL